MKKIKKMIVMFLTICIFTSTFIACGGESKEKTNDNEKVEVTPVSIKKSVNSNPITGFNKEGKLIYGGDPAALVDNDKVYLYTGNDTSTNDSYVIPRWQCYSTTDMLNWTYEGVILECKDIQWADKNSAWAAQCAKHYDAASGKDKYYFYYCSWNSQDDGKQSIGVAVSDSPTGPFTDIGHALVNGSLTTDETSGWNDIDPTVWVEKDENGVEHRYLLWGNGKNYVCELNEDMISVKDLDGDGKITFNNDVISKTTPESFTEAPWIYRRQNENGDYYGDYYMFYAYAWREKMAYVTTDNLLTGQWSKATVIMEPTATSNTNHMSVINFKGETYFIYHNGSLPKGSGYRRVACIAKLEFESDGTVKYINEVSTGLGGTISTISDMDGNLIGHESFTNSSSDDAYPYLNLNVGTDIGKAEDEDYYWEIVQGRSTDDDTYISIEAYNKPGLYMTSATAGVRLSQDSTGSMGIVQTFKVVKGLAGEGISLISAKDESQFVTMVKGKLKMSDGSDKKACTFIIKELEK